jgi:hypothetical protein
MPKHNNDLKRLRCQQSISRERTRIKESSSSERTSDDIRKHEALLKEAAICFLADLMKSDKESTTKLSDLCRVLGSPLNTVIRETGPQKNLLVDLFEIAMMVKGVKIFYDSGKLKVDLPEESLSKLRKKQFLVNENLTKLLGYQNQSQMKVFFSFSYFAKTLNE